MYSTYSFKDVSVVVSHPSFGQYIATGTGLGQISVSMSTDNTSHDVAADGTVMVSKVEGQNGTIAMQIQQTSDFQKWLIRLYNYLLSSPASEWARASIVIRSAMMQDLITATGVSPQKLADKQYQKQGQNGNWSLMAANIDQQVA